MGEPPSRVLAVSAEHTVSFVTWMGELSSKWQSSNCVQYPAMTLFLVTERQTLSMIELLGTTLTCAQVMGQVRFEKIHRRQIASEGYGTKILEFPVPNPNLNLILNIRGCFGDLGAIIL